MIKFLNKIPAGTFLVPLIISMLFYTFWPSLFQIGGFTELFLGGGMTSGILSLIVFASGTTIKLEGIGSLLRHQGSIILAKFVWATLLSFIYFYLFGHEGILGVSAVAFVTAMYVVNPAIQYSLTQNYGQPGAGQMNGVYSLFALPIFPLTFFTIFGSAGSGVGIDWMPIISTLIPLFVGILLGNLDDGFTQLFSGIVGGLLPILGWSLGQGLNLFEALSSGVSGVILTLMFFILMLPLIGFEQKILKEDGVTTAAMLNASGSSTATPAAVAAVIPAVGSYASSASTQLLMIVIILAVVSPIVTQKVYESMHGPKEKTH